MNAVAGGHFAVRGTPKNDPIRPLEFIENQWFYNSFQPFAALKIRFKICLHVYPYEFLRESQKRSKNNSLNDESLRE